MVVFVASIILPILLVSNLQAQQAPHGPQVSSAPQPVSMGGVLGDPLGVTMRYAFGSGKAFDAGFGLDYFGSPRLQMDYVWLFHAFPSNVFAEYAGPGLAVAFAKGSSMFYTHEGHTESFAASEDNKFGFGGRAIVGMSITPKASSFEFFVESGPMIAMTHIFDLDLDGAIGVRCRL